MLKSHRLDQVLPGTHVSSPPTDPGLMAKACNNAILGQVIEAARELGLFEALIENDQLQVDEFCSRSAPQLRAEVIEHIANLLTGVGVLSSPALGTYMKGPKMEEVLRDLGYGAWLLRACRTLISDIGGYAVTGSHERAVYSRDGRATAESSAMIGVHHVDPIMYPFINEVPFRTVCDLGCGSAQRIRRLVRDAPGAQAIGVEINADAVQSARKGVSDVGLGNSIQIIEGDVTRMSTIQNHLRDVDLLLMCFMGHDLWPRERVEAVFRSFHVVFPKCRRFVFADTVRGERVPWDSMPNFQVGFELIHALQGQQIPDLQDWDQVFDATGWNVRKRRPLGVPNTYVFDLAPAERKCYAI
ncbi:MAG TPA: class I SAM-dependent methyltransferase [Fimbriimonadaceae bacterium]|nr:class I SAM-dependent methyltransferase [Fimbriimonadaceae bacterium]